MILSKILNLPNSLFSIRLKSLILPFFYNRIVTSAYEKSKQKSSFFPEGLHSIIRNNYVVAASIAESSKELTLHSISLLEHNPVLTYLNRYPLNVLLRRSTLIADLKKFRLPSVVAVLIIPYLRFLVVLQIITILTQEQWTKATHSQVRILIKNLKFLSSGETNDIWLDFSYLNNYLIQVDKSDTYKNLSSKSQSSIQATIHKFYGIDTTKFLQAFKRFPKSMSLSEKIQYITQQLYKRYRLPYFLLFTALTTSCLLLIHYLFHSFLFTLLSLPLLLLSAYDMTNYFIQPFVPPRITLALNSKTTVPTTWVAATIPFIISSVRDIKKIGLELQQLKKANPHYTHVKYFALIDCADSLEFDEIKLTEMRAALESLCLLLNKDLPASQGNAYFYFLRKSRYSKKQQRYMGWERKRGKTVEFIKYLNNEVTDSTVYSNYTGDIPFKYLFTIDEGSHVSKDIIKELLLRAECLGNEPILNEQTNTVEQGYGIFQPSISSKQDFNKNLFQKTFNQFEKYHVYGVTEDVTFNIFGEYNYQGKGMIDIEMYRKVCVDRFPDDVLLSHDLIEGSYLRVAHVDECTIFESFPSGLNPYLQRSNRWMRGDMNTILWLLPLLTLFSVKLPHNSSINILAKFRILINLLNVVKAPLLVISPLFLGMPISGLFFNWLLSQFTWLFGLLKEIKYFLFQKQALAFKIQILSKKIDYWRLYEFLTIPLQATNALYAMIISFIRIFITHHNTLDWISSRNAEKGTKIISKDLGIKLFILIASVSLIHLQYGIVLTIFSLIALGISYLLNKKYQTATKISATDAKYLQNIANLTWNFFDTYVTRQTHFLPPDNVTKGKPSKYTSITNIGFYFLSLVCAHKLGFITDKVFLRYFKRSFESLTKLPMYQGHFYNWYDVTTLKVAPPHFISSVDSGNFYGCMVCVRQYIKKLKIKDSHGREIDELLKNMKFTFFLNKFDQLSVGYYVKTKRRSRDNYDNFASEARLAVYIAIAMENVPESAWGNLLRPFNRNGTLLSWGGTVFEYTLPQLFLKTYRDSLGYKSFENLLASNLNFAHKFHLPWGLSESLYIDEITKTYEYKPIGIAELSRDPLQTQNTTIAPYATALMSLIDVKKVVANFVALENLNLLTEYGFVEAITFSKTAKPLMIDSHMSHHQGMLLAALTNVLTDNMFVTLFNSYATMETIDYILDERVPDYPDIADERAVKFSIGIQPKV